jgi:hypothetical protein
MGDTQLIRDDCAERLDSLVNVACTKAVNASQIEMVKKFCRNCVRGEAIPWHDDLRRQKNMPGQGVRA